MPFLESAKVTGVAVEDHVDPARPPEVVLAATDTFDEHGYLENDNLGEFRVLTPLCYRADNGEPYVVPPNPEGSTTDLASVPAFMWGLLAPYGRQLRPALLHDFLCNHVKDSSPDQWFSIRRSADDLFREALASCGVSVLRRSLFWAGVTLGRYLAYRLWFALVVIALAVLSVSIIWYDIFSVVAGLVSDDGDLSLGLLLLAALVLLVVGVALASWTEAGAVLLISVVAPLVAPAGVVVLLTQGLLFVIDWPLTQLWKLRGKRSGYATPGPMLNWPRAHKD
jgi:hypothetical protein